MSKTHRKRKKQRLRPIFKPSQLFEILRYLGAVPVRHPPVFQRPGFQAVSACVIWRRAKNHANALSLPLPNCTLGGGNQVLLALLNNYFAVVRIVPYKSSTLTSQSCRVQIRKRPQGPTKNHLLPPRTLRSQDPFRSNNLCCLFSPRP